MIYTLATEEWIVVLSYTEDGVGGEQFIAAEGEAVEKPWG